MIKNLINYCVGIVMGTLAVYMWEYDKFLYYSVFMLQAVILYIIINYCFLTDIKTKEVKEK